MHIHRRVDLDKQITYTAAAIHIYRRASTFQSLNYPGEDASTFESEGVSLLTYTLKRKGKYALSIPSRGEFRVTLTRRFCTATVARSDMNDIRVINSREEQHSSCIAFEAALLLLSISHFAAPFLKKDTLWEPICKRPNGWSRRR